MKGMRPAVARAMLAMAFSSSPQCGAAPHVFELTTACDPLAFQIPLDQDGKRVARNPHRRARKRKSGLHKGHPRRRRRGFN